MTDTQFLPSEATLEDIVEKRQQMMEAIKQLKEGRKVLDEELLHRLDEMKITGKTVGNWGMVKAHGVSFSGVKMETARELGAVKEAVDSQKLRKLFDKGIEIEGQKEYSYLIIRSIEKVEE